MHRIKNIDCLHILLFFIGLYPFFTVNGNDIFNLPLVHLSNQVTLGEPVIIWSDTVKTLNVLPNNIQSGCISAYSHSDHRGCIEAPPVSYGYNQTAAYKFRLEKRSHVVAGVTYHLGIQGDIIGGVRNFNSGNQGHNTRQLIHPNFNNPNILNEGYNFGPYEANYCGNSVTDCIMNAIVFLAGNTHLYLYAIIPSDILDTSHFEFNNLPLASLQVQMGRYSNSNFTSNLPVQRIDLLFSGSIEVDRRCYVATDKSHLSFPTIKNNMNNGVVGQAKLTVTSTCHNLGYRTSLSLKLVPVNASALASNIMTFATSENGSQALGILFNPEHYPTQCDGNDSQPFHHYLFLASHEAGLSSSTIQQDIHFSLCKYGIPSPGKHTTALDMYVQWEN